MKKSLLVLSLAASAAAFAHAQGTLTLSTDYNFQYSAQGGLTIADSELDGSYYGVGTIDYAFDYAGSFDAYEPYIWTLQIAGSGDYSVNGSGSSAYSFDSGPLVINDIVGVGPFSVADVTGLFGATPLEALFAVANFLDDLPNPGNFADIASALGDGSPAGFLSQIEYYHNGSFPDARLDLALSAPLLGYFDIYSGSLIGDLDITLTLSSPVIVPVPEPSTYGLIGAGALALLIGFRRFRARKAIAA